MGVFDFVKDAGEKIGIGDDNKKTKTVRSRRKTSDQALAKAKREKAAADRAAKSAARKRQQANARVKAARAKASKAKETEAAEEARRGFELQKYVSQMGLKARGLDIKFDDGIATVTGTAANKATKEKIVLALGNTEGVSRVVDKLRVAPQKKGAAPANAAARARAQRKRREAAAAQTTHTVKSGDTLSAIAKKYLGDANRYGEIFNANKPMLTDPNMIYPGQVLRIPKK